MVKYDFSGGYRIIIRGCKNIVFVYDVISVYAVKYGLIFKKFCFGVYR
jgi:hypothetical protein